MTIRRPRRRLSELLPERQSGDLVEGAVERGPCSTVMTALAGEDGTPSTRWRVAVSAPRRTRHVRVHRRLPPRVARRCRPGLRSRRSRRCRSSRTLWFVCRRTPSCVLQRAKGHQRTQGDVELARERANSSSRSGAVLQLATTTRPPVLSLTHVRLLRSSGTWPRNLGVLHTSPPAMAARAVRRRGR